MFFKKYFKRNEMKKDHITRPIEKESIKQKEELAFDEHQRALVAQQSMNQSQIASQHNPFSPLYPPFQPNTSHDECDLMFDREYEQDREYEDFEEYSVEEINYEDYSR